MPEPLHKKAATLVRRHGLAGACAHVFKVIRKNGDRIYKLNQIAG